MTTHTLELPRTLIRTALAPAPGPMTRLERIAARQHQGLVHDALFALALVATGMIAALAIAS